MVLSWRSSAWSPPWCPVAGDGGARTYTKQAGFQASAAWRLGEEKVSLAHSHTEQQMTNRTKIIRTTQNSRMTTCPMPPTRMRHILWILLVVEIVDSTMEGNYMKKLLVMAVLALGAVGAAGLAHADNDSNFGSGVDAANSRNFTTAAVCLRGLARGSPWSRPCRTGRAITRTTAPTATSSITASSPGRDVLRVGATRPCVRALSCSRAPSRTEVRLRE